MARLATPVPRRRLRATRPARIPRPGVASAPPARFDPYSAVFGPGGVVREPSDSTAEKLAPGPGATKAAATTPPPAKSGGNSGNLTVPGYTPATPTVPYNPSEPGHSAADFKAAFAAKEQHEAQRRLERQLGTLQPLAPPGVTLGTTSAVNRLAEVAGRSLANPAATAGSALDQLLHQAQGSPQELLKEVPDLTTELRSPEPVHVAPQATISSMLKASEQTPTAAPRAAAAARPQKIPPAQAGQLKAQMITQFGSTPGAATEQRDAQIMRQFEAQTGYQWSDFDITGKPIAANLATGGAKAVPAVDFTNRKDPLGAKTLGNVTTQRLAAAAKAGSLHINAKGILSTPENRQVLQRLIAAHQALKVSGGGGNTVEDQIGRFLLGHGLDRVGASGIIGNSVQESGLDPTAMEPGTHNGGLWGFTAEPNSLANLEEFAAAKGADWKDPKVQSEFLLQHVSPDTISNLNHASSPEEAARIFQEEFEHPYAPTANTPRREEGAATAFAGAWSHPDPEAQANLRQAQQQARAHGINPAPWNGDVEGGDKEYVYVRADAKGAVNWAKSTLGTQEGSSRQLHWADLEALGPSEPWCADWVAVNLARRGVALPPGPNNTASYEQDWPGGTVIGTDIAKAKPGDLVAYGNGAHIAMYVGDGKVIAGNWGDEVAEYGATEDARGISAIVRPHYKGGRVKVKAGQLPGSSTESTFGGGVTGPEGSVGGAVPAAASEGQVQGGGRTPQQAASAEAALAGFGPLAAPGFAAGVTTPEFGGVGSAEELLALLTQAAGARTSRA